MAAATAYKRAAGSRGLTPLQQAAELVHVMNAGAGDDPAYPAVPPEFGPGVAMYALDDERLVYQRERDLAHRTARAFGDWLAALAAFDKIPTEDVLTLLLLLPAAVEVELMVRVTWPELYEGHEPEQFHAVRTAAEAMEAGLTVKAHHRRRERKRRPLVTPTLPGCQGGFLTGDPAAVCHELRVRGHDLCPACEQSFATKMSESA